MVQPVSVIVYKLKHYVSYTIYTLHTEPWGISIFTGTYVKHFPRSKNVSSKAIYLTGRSSILANYKCIAVCHGELSGVRLSSYLSRHHNQITSLVIDRANLSRIRQALGHSLDNVNTEFVM